jgi:hypothetical protein
MFDSSVANLGWPWSPGWPLTSPSGGGADDDVQITPAHADDRPWLDGLTFPAYRALLDAATDPAPPVIALVAKADGAPIGLALGRPEGQPLDPQATDRPARIRLLSVAVATHWRRPRCWMP